MWDLTSIKVKIYINKIYSKVHLAIVKGMKSKAKTQARNKRARFVSEAKQTWNIICDVTKLVSVNS